MNDRLVHARWWLAYPTAVALAIALDIALSFWHPFPPRLPEQFSPAYLRLYLSSVPKDKPALVVLGDSVLWGYKVSANDTAASMLQRRYPNLTVLNLSYEGGSTPNSAVMLRAVLNAGVRVAGVVVNVNSKEFSPADSAYRTLHPALERYAYAGLNDDDRSLLVLHPRNDLNTRLNDFVERTWRFYGLRADIRERVFGTDDMASFLLALVQRVTGEEATAAATHRPSPDRFLGTYDLAPIGADNVQMIYYRKLLDELCSNRIPAIAFLTPTNHALLHRYIDWPEYDDRLRQLTSVSHCNAVRIVNLDRAIPASEFLDNDHLTERGHALLYDELSPTIARFVP